MGERQRRDVADHDHRDLHVPGVLLREDGVVDPRVDRPEQVPALPERVRGEVDDRLPLEEQERQVVRGDVDGGDRDERVDEAELELGEREPAADRARALDPEPVEAGDEADAEQQAERRRDLRRRQRADPEPVERVDDVRRDVLPQLALREAVEGDGADHHGHERHGAGRVVQPRQPAQRPPHTEDAVAHLPHRHAGEHVVVDRERLAAARPRLDAPVELGGERQQRVAERGRDERRRLLAPPAHELDPREDPAARRRRASARAAPDTAGSATAAGARSPGTG